jgi:hypothetical protein
MGKLLFGWKKFGWKEGGGGNLNEILMNDRLKWRQEGGMIWL